MSNIHSIDSSKYTENLYITQNNATIYAVSSLALSALFAIGYAFAKGALEKKYALAAAAACIGAAAISLYRVCGITILKDHEYKCITVNKDENRAIFENGVGNTLVVESQEVFYFTQGEIYLINRDTSANNIYELISKKSGKLIKAQKMIVPTKHENPSTTCQMVTFRHFYLDAGHIQLDIGDPKKEGKPTLLFKVKEMSSNEVLEQYCAKEILKKMSRGDTYYLVLIDGKDHYRLSPIYDKKLIDGVTLEPVEPVSNCPLVHFSLQATKEDSQPGAKYETYVDARDDSVWDSPA